MKRISVLLLLVSLLGGLLSACRSQKAQPTATLAPTLPPPPTATRTPLPTPTLPPTPIPSPTPTLAPSPTPFVPFDAAAAVDNVNLRENPGYLFKVLAKVKQGTPLKVTGRSPGGEWILVQAPNDAQGWVFNQLLEQGKDYGAAPLVQPQNVQLLQGKVVDQQGNPVSGIQFMILQGGGTSPTRNDAMTDADGNFYAFMPPDSAGTWQVAYTAIACTSNQMDENCNSKNGVSGNVDPLAVTINLPHSDPLVFVWKLLPIGG